MISAFLWSSYCTGAAIFAYIGGRHTRYGAALVIGVSLCWLPASIFAYCYHWWTRR